VIVGTIALAAGREEVVDTLEEVAETEGVEVVLELVLETVDTVGDRIAERILETKSAVVDVAGLFFSFPPGFVAVGSVRVVSAIGGANGGSVGGALARLR
jgi:hypothetical protein